jgi:hypothetical protein
MRQPPSAGARLLRADEEQIERAARVLRAERAFVLVVCPTELREQAQAVLRKHLPGLTLAEPKGLGTPDEVLDELLAAKGLLGVVLSLRFERDVKGALQTLNWHREKLLAGAPVVLWLEDEARFAELREWAPDAYSFRSGMAVVRGDGGPLPVPSQEESAKLVQARRRLKRARSPLERADAGRALADELRLAGKLEEAERVAENALGALPLTADGEEAHEVRALLCVVLAAMAHAEGKSSRAYSWMQQALMTADKLSLSRGLPLRVTIASFGYGPFRGQDRTLTVEALRLARTYGLAPEVREHALRSMELLARGTGDLRKAYDLSAERRALALHHAGVELALLTRDRGDLEREAGRIDAAEAHYREAASVFSASGSAMPEAALRLMLCALDQGELEAASALMEAVPGARKGDFYTKNILVSEVGFVRGEVANALALLRTELERSAHAKQDQHCLNAASALASSLEEASDAERLEAEDRAASIAALEAGRDATLAATGAECAPWIPLRFAEDLTQILALDAATQERAIETAREALESARHTYPDLIPECGRILAQILLRAGHLDEARDLAAAIEPEASSRDFLKELAYLRSIRLQALVRQGAEPAALSAALAALAALRETLDATGSPRITAEVLRDLAIKLPPTATTPDPLSLADEAHTLFLAMPIPAEEARCLEAAGDILRVRGRTLEAKRRYLTARTRLERLGIALRLPLLTRKIEALG